MSDTRADDLEIKIAFLERQVEALDEVVRLTSAEVVTLQRTVDRLQARMAADGKNED